MAWVFVVIYVAFGVAVPAVFLLGNHNTANARSAGSS